MTHSKIVVTGGSGLVGKALKKYLPNAIYLSSKDFDLTNEKEDENLKKINNIDERAYLHRLATIHH